MSLSGPSRRSIVWMKEEVHVDEAKDEPIVSTVFEEIEEGHSVI